ncbi:MAG: trimeric intracellular cation channel family protein [Parvibaculum sp.]|uniref:trimeric intracellular cation channel family protein n=1 Tax=Parvibaculum sp. TaxID=2024848 RepID=UPI0034A09C59
MTHLHLLVSLQFVGIAAFAVSGALVAGERQMDWFGVMVLGIIVAVGGGTLRDILLDAPVFWIGQSWYVAVAAAAALAAIPAARWAQKARRPIAVADAVGLAVFVALGTRKSLEMGTSGFVAVIMGVVTGIVGGIIRDVLANRTPIILKKEVYALAALTGAMLYVAADSYGIGSVLSLWGTIGAVLGIRLLAIFYDWSIPTLTIKPDRDS